MTSIKLPRGVAFDKAAGKYRARMGVRGKTVDLGKFATPEEAAAAYAAGVEKHGAPVYGRLTPAQEAKRDRNSRAWLAAREAFDEAVQRALGPWDATRPWAIGGALPFGKATTYRLARYRREVTVHGEIELVAEFETPCLKLGCCRPAVTHLWLGFGRRCKTPRPQCQEHDGGHVDRHTASRELLVASYFAARQSLDAADQPTPSHLRDEVKRRAGLLRRHLLLSLDVLYDGVSDMPEDWWEQVPFGEA